MNDNAKAKQLLDNVLKFDPAWDLWLRETIDGEDIKVPCQLNSTYEEVVALMSDRRFALVPQSDPEFRTTIASRMSPNIRRKIASIAGMTAAEAFALPLLELVTEAKRQRQQNIGGVDNNSARKASNGTRKKKNMSREIANEILLELLKKDASKYAGMSQRKLADEVGCSRETLRNTEAYQSIDALREALKNQ